MCRKAHGAPFATFTDCPSEAFEWLAGESNIRTYSSSTDLTRAFCKTCGSAVPGTVSSGERVFMPAASFDDDPMLRGGQHLFVGSKAAWHQIADDLVQHDGYPGDSQYVDLDVAERPALEPASSGIMRGSCLCGSCAFEVTAPFQAVHNCHCSRCRKARGAAHTTNGFVPAESVNWVRGRDLVEVYILPTAKAFSQAFCTNCGSGMPRTDKTDGLISVPFGSLDDEPNMGPMDHIFTDSRAPWYDPEDDLPKFEQLPT